VGEHQHPSETYLAETAIYDKVCAIDKAALVTRQEHHGVCLLDGLAEATAREMHLTAEALGVIITEPVLQEGSATNTVSG
jgi:hypothetical protein